MQGVAAPAPGTIVIATETAPVAGKVVSTRQEAAGLVVTLALAPLYQLFSAYDIRLTIELADFPFETVPDPSALSAHALVWSGGQRGKARALASKRGLEAFEPFKVLKCDTSFEGKLLGEPPINLKLDNKLKLVLEDRPGYSKRVLEGSLAIVGSAGVKLQAGVTVGGTCNAQGKLDVPITGVFKVVVVPAVRVGLGVELKGEFRVVEAELGVQGTVGFSGVLGWECGGASPPCTGLNTITPLRELETKSEMPSVNGMKALGSAHFYVVAGLDASIFGGLFNASIAEARIGPKQSFDLAFEADQAALRGYASTYDLKLEGVIEPGASLKEVIKLIIDDDAVGVDLKATFQSDLSESPKGTLSVNKARVGVGGEVDFTVELDPKTINYFLLNYNVVSVELYRKGETEADFKPWKSMPRPTEGQTTFRYQWKPVEIDVGKYEFAAFVNTKVPTPWLEIAKNSIQPVEVSCFTAGALSATSVSRKQRLAAAADGTRVSPQASNSCVDTWVGTASYMVKTPGLPTANIAIRSNITWTDDKTLSGPLATYYRASGSFDLVFNHPDPTCTIALSPSNFTIVDDPLTPSRLGIINDGFNPPTYGFGGAQLVNVTSTALCPGRDPVVTELRGLQVFYAKGNGPFTVGQARLSGTYDDATETYTWDFSRP